GVADGDAPVDVVERRGRGLRVEAACAPRVLRGDAVLAVADRELIAGAELMIELAEPGRRVDRIRILARRNRRTVVAARRKLCVDGQNGGGQDGDETGL